MVLLVNLRRAHEQMSHQSGETGGGPMRGHRASSETEESQKILILQRALTTSATGPFRRTLAQHCVVLTHLSLPNAGFSARMVLPLESLLGPSPRRDKVEAGRQLMEQTLSENSGLFISENIAQLRSAFQNELQLLIETETVDHRLSSSLLQNTLYISLLALLIGIASFFIDWLILTIILSLVLLVSISLLKFYKLYSNKQFCDAFAALTRELRSEKELYKQMLQLVEDSYFDNENESAESRFKTLKVTFRDVALKSFLHLRQCTNLLLDRFPLKIDTDDNLICRVPEESFEPFNNNDELTLQALKTLKQLIRLQISELLMRCFLLFIPNYFLNLRDFDDNDFCSYLQANIFKQILSESQNNQKTLLSSLFYYKSFYQEVATSPRRTPLDTDRLNFWPICRNIRKSLYSSLAIIDNFEVMFNANEELSAEDKAIIECKLATLNSEIATMQDSTQNILKLMKRQVPQQQKVENDAQISSEAEEATASMSKAFVDEYIAQDEVFEAYVPQKDIEQNLQKGVDSAEIENSTLEDAVASTNVFHELKHALKNKAIEHKVREAKALGIEVDVKQLEEEYITTVIEKTDSQERKRIFVSETRKETVEGEQEKAEESIIGHNTGDSSDLSVAFNLDIAMKATERMRLMLTTEDTFECDSDS